MNHLDTDWSAAACRDHDAELFFPVGDGEPARRQAERAKRICAGCAIAVQCLRWALDSGTVDGVWGGYTSQERRKLRHLRTMSTAHVT